MIPFRSCAWSPNELDSMFGEFNSPLKKYPMNKVLLVLIRFIHFDRIILSSWCTSTEKQQHRLWWPWQQDSAPYLISCSIFTEKGVSKAPTSTHIRHDLLNSKYPEGSEFAIFKREFCLRLNGNKNDAFSRIFVATNWHTKEMRSKSR